MLRISKIPTQTLQLCTLSVRCTCHHSCQGFAASFHLEALEARPCEFALHRTVGTCMLVGQRRLQLNLRRASFQPGTTGYLKWKEYMQGASQFPLCAYSALPGCAEKWRGETMSALISSTNELRCIADTSPTPRITKRPGTEDHENHEDHEDQKTLRRVPPDIQSCGCGMPTCPVHSDTTNGFVSFPGPISWSPNNACSGGAPKTACQCRSALVLERHC